MNTTFFTLVILFFVLSPGVLFRLPPTGSCYVAALVHAIIFVFVLGLVSPDVYDVAEGFKRAFCPSWKRSLRMCK
jgi:hypothetical protein